MKIGDAEVNWPSVPLGDAFRGRSGSVDPAKYPDEVFELYSIPAYDSGEPQNVHGSEIGSAKQTVTEGDLLLSRIVPHIRRAWIVGPGSGNRKIASGEWIVLRDDRIDPRYLRHWLLGDRFHAQFMNTVSGVGGSLLRANPRHVSKIEIPLPPLPEQRRIAEILDRADTLRAKRREAITKLDSLTQSIFTDMFGHDSSQRDWRRVSLSEAYWFQEGPGVRKWQFQDEGVKLLNVGNIKKSGILELESTDKYLSEDEAFGKYKHFLADAGDLVIASSGISFDADGLLRTRGAFIESDDLPLCMNTSTIRFKSLAGISDLRYLWAWLDSYDFRKQISQRVTGSAQQNFGPTHLKALQISLPPVELQSVFAKRVEAAGDVKVSMRLSQEASEGLFASLQHRGFSGLL